jgi:hypothetical protein
VIHEGTEPKILGTLARLPSTNSRRTERFSRK